MMGFMILFIISFLRCQDILVPRVCYRPICNYNYINQHPQSVYYCLFAELVHILENFTFFITFVAFVTRSILACKAFAAYHSIFLIFVHIFNCYQYKFAFPHTVFCLAST